MLHISTLSGVFHTVIRCQAPKKEGGNRGETMKKEKEEEWIDRIVNCPDCEKGRTVFWRERKSGKPPWRYRFPCVTCKGEYQTVVFQPKYCQLEGCENPAKEKCGGYSYERQFWVCEEHWIEDPWC